MPEMGDEVGLDVTVAMGEDVPSSFILVAQNSGIPKG
jgi:hypothetical protein